MSSALQFEVLDLRHFSAGNLRPLLDAESRVWSERLHWDYRGSAALLLQYLDSRVLPGYVAVDNGRVMGYTFCVYEGHKAVIGDVYALGTDEDAAEVRDELLRHLLEMLQASPGVNRIESQLLLHPHGSHNRIFLDAGFGIHERIFMEWPLTPGMAAQCAEAGAWRSDTGIAMRRWSEGDFAAASRLIAHAYEGHHDSFINEQYRTAQGSHRFLHNIVRFPGCGYFDSDSSRSVILHGSPELAGLLLCSRVREDAGHVTQICVAPEYRRQGMAQALMMECARNLAARKFSLLTLTVTASNQTAVALYERLGFRGTHRFDAMVWDNTETPAVDLFPPRA
jgi:ribosomal protein S18 acetylase RimI-like enzyme